MVLSQFLSFLRAQSGAESAKSFHLQLQKRGLECNYPTYSKIETGRMIPSPQLLAQLAEAVPPKWKDELVLAYSRTQLPQFAYLFPAEITSRTASPSPGPSPKAVPARELTKRQVAILARGSANYHLFLILTMARNPLPRREVERKFKKDVFEKALADLDAGEFLESGEGQSLRIRTTEWRFPSAEGDSGLQKTYRQFDEWDLSFGDQFGFETLLQKMLIRRISPRYLSLIQKQLEVSLDMVRTSDELEPKYNESLVQVRVQLKSGRLPG